MLWIFFSVFLARADDCMSLAGFSPQACERPVHGLCSGFATGGLVSSCHTEYFESCVQLAHAELKATSVTPITLLVQQELFYNPETCAKLSALHQADRRHRLQMVPVQEPAKFMRDPGVVLSRRQGALYLALPYGMMGAKSVAATIARCNRVEVEGGLDDVPLFVQNALYENDLDPQTWQWRTEGGNVLPLPGDFVLVGQTPGRRVPLPLLQHLRRSQRVIEVTIPPLQVGHIDEVFALVSRSGPACPQQFLVASPANMREFLRGLNGNEPLLPGQSVHQVLADEKWMSQWTDWQNQIDRAKAIVQKSYHPPHCGLVQFVDVPVFWNAKGRAPLTNPVNGIFIEDQYLLSKPHREGQKLKDFAAYQKELERVLPGLKTFADIPQYDLWGGNVHCATLQLPVSCTN